MNSRNTDASRFAYWNNLAFSVKIAIKSLACLVTIVVGLYTLPSIFGYQFTKVNNSIISTTNVYEDFVKQPQWEIEFIPYPINGVQTYTRVCNYFKRHTMSLYFTIENGKCVSKRSFLKGYYNDGRVREVSVNVELEELHDGYYLAKYCADNITETVQGTIIFTKQAGCMYGVYAGRSSRETQSFVVGEAFARSGVSDCPARKSDRNPPCNER